MGLATAIVRTPDSDVEKLRGQGFDRFMNFIRAGDRLVTLNEVKDNDEKLPEPKTSNGWQAFCQWIKTLFALVKKLIGNSRAG